ncbi:MAG: hypothetical protein CMH57_11640 [Myxococcales bacterium]|nr:hypothetical protein [Myxococcales bacterium]
MHCLNCETRMEVVSSQGVEYEQCFVCGSAWLDQGELQTLLAREAPEWDDALLEARARLPQRCRWCDALYPPGTARCPPCGKPLEHPCPRDDTPMFIVEEHGVEVDVCLTCKGIWFDGRELEQILAASGAPPRHAPGTPPPSPGRASVPSLEACVICDTPTPVARQVFAGGAIRCLTCHEDIGDAAPLPPTPRPRPTNQLTWARGPQPSEAPPTTPTTSGDGYWEQQDTDLRGDVSTHLGGTSNSIISTLTRLLFGQRRS